MASLAALANNCFHVKVLTLKNILLEKIWIRTTKKVCVKILPFVTYNLCVIIVFPLTFYFDRKCMRFHKTNKKTLGVVLFRSCFLRGSFWWETRPNYLEMSFIQPNFLQTILFQILLYENVMLIVFMPVVDDKIFKSIVHVY